MKFRKYIFLIFLFYSYAPILAQVDTAWVRRYDGTHGWDIANALAIDGSGNVYVTGESEQGGFGSLRDYATIKYAPNGDTLWVRHYRGGGASALAVDDSGNVYVTGFPVTIKYLPNGDTAWVRSYWGGDLTVDGSGNVYVTGNGTIKYLPNGDTAWVRSYGGVDLTVDGSGNLYVTGSGTIKYLPNGDTAWVRHYNSPWNLGGELGLWQWIQVGMCM